MSSIPGSAGGYPFLERHPNRPDAPSLGDIAPARREGRLAGIDIADAEVSALGPKLRSKWADRLSSGVGMPTNRPPATYRLSHLPPPTDSAVAFGAQLTVSLAVAGPIVPRRAST